MTPNHRLPADWLNDNTAKAAPWILTGTDPSHPHWRDACMGNGFVGQRVGPAGDGSDYSMGSGSFMADLWGKARENPARKEGLVELPVWATLNLLPGVQEERRDRGARSQYTQELDLYRSVMTTRYRTQTLLGTFEIEKKFWICQHQPELAVIELQVHCVDGGIVGDDGKRHPLSICLHEDLDASDMSDLKDVQNDHAEACLYMDLVLENDRHISLGSRWLHLSKDDPPIVKGREHLTRRQVIRIQKNETQRFTKLVAITADVHSPHPDRRCRQLLEENHDLESLRKSHEQAWAKLWERRIEVDHPRLQQLIHVSLYQLYSSLRQNGNWSHGPCGLTGNGWDGLVFWDTDTWTLPIYALFQPGMAKSCNLYRHRTIEGARSNAKTEGEEGSRWAWMSGETGSETCSYRVFQEERHIVSCVALAQWIYTICSGDKAWFSKDAPGLEILIDCAKYWASRAKPNEDGSWSIRMVCGSDEHAGRVTDNYTTNVGAQWVLRTASKCMVASGHQPPELWKTIADGLRFLWLDTPSIPKQMKEWQHGQVIKQADTVMTVHPWNQTFRQETMEAMVDYYRDHYPPQPIMMGLAIDAIIDSRLNREQGLRQCLDRLLAHFGGPYLTASEHPQNERAPFITGYGGFLQLVVFGMAGLQWSLEDLDAPLNFQPCLPAGVTHLTLHNISFHGEQKTFVLNAEGVNAV